MVAAGTAAVADVPAPVSAGLDAAVAAARCGGNCGPIISCSSSSSSVLASSSRWGAVEPPPEPPPEPLPEPLPDPPVCKPGGNAGPMTGDEGGGGGAGLNPGRPSSAGTSPDFNCPSKSMRNVGCSVSLRTMWMWWKCMRCVNVLITGSSNARANTTSRINLRRNARWMRCKTSGSSIGMTCLNRTLFLKNCR